MSQSTLELAEVTASKAELIKSNSLLTQLDSQSISKLSVTSRWQDYPKGSIIWMHGADQPWFGLVECGFVKMVRSCESGREATMEIMGPRQTFGSLGAVEGSGCPLSAVAITDTRILRVPKSEFLDAYFESRSLQQQMIRMSAQRFFAKLDLMAQLTTGRVESRIANVLLMLSESYGAKKGSQITIEVPLTRQDISDFIGITLETTIRTLSAWTKQGLISSTKSYITILNNESLHLAAKA